MNTTKWLSDGFTGWLIAVGISLLTWCSVTAIISKLLGAW